MSNKILITNTNGLDRMMNIKNKRITVYDTRNQHMFRVLYFRQTDQKTISYELIQKSQMCHTNRVEMHINTHIGKNETIEASQYIC